MGIITFSTFYSAQIWAVATISNVEWVITYGLTLPASGFFVLYYWNRLKQLRGNLLFISLFYRRRVLISRLVRQRSDIVGILEVAKEDYLQQQVSKWRSENKYSTCLNLPLYLMKKQEIRPDEEDGVVEIAPSHKRRLWHTKLQYQNSWKWELIRISFWDTRQTV